MKQYLYEGIGTAALVFFGCGCSCLAAYDVGILGIGLSFGLTYIIWSLLFGNVSLCHLNPLLTFATFVAKKIEKKDFVCNVVAQFIGALVGALFLVFLIIMTAKPADLFVSTFWANGYDMFSPSKTGIFAAILIEIILSALLVLFYLAFVVRKNRKQASIVAFGVCYAIIVAVGYNFTCGCVNPARAFGPSVFMAINGDVISLLQFVVISLSTIVGSLIAIVLYRCIWKNDCGDLRFKFLNIGK